jgi:hypothetical protein
MLSCGVVCLALWLAPAWGQGSGVKKLIYYGWGIRDTQYIRDHSQEMEKMPFDGTGIIVAIDRQAWQQGKHSTENQLGWQVMGRKAFRIEEFRDAIADLKAVRWRTFTDNFLPAALSSVYAQGLNWFDDERWRLIVNNFKVLVQIAEEGKIRGFILDPEDYNNALFSYSSQQQYVDRPFEEYFQMVRQRGRQVMGAIAERMPNAALLVLYGYTLPLRELQRSSRRQEQRYPLLAAFYDGLLEAMPSGGQFIDGYEFAYGFKEPRQFLDSYRQIRHDALAVSTVPDRYREKVRAAFGLWLDYDKRPNYFTPEEFRRAVSQALEVSDGYVWIYSHGPRFFPLSGVDSSFLDAIAAARRSLRR